MNPAQRDTAQPGRIWRRRLPVLALATALAGAGSAAVTSASAATGTGTVSSVQQRIGKAYQLATAGGRTARQTQVAGTAGTTTTKNSTTGVQPYIVGGSTTTISSAPWMVQLWYYDDRGTADQSDDIGFFCGGTLVAPNKVLTAAHCASGFNWAANGAILAGDSNLPVFDAAGNYSGPGRVVGVRRQWTAAFNKSTTDNDVAVLTLSGALPLSSTIKALPIAASTDSALYKAGTNATVYGWGLTSSAANGQQADQLKTATLAIQSDTTCDTALKNVLGEDDFINGHMICAGKPSTGSDATTTTTCSGDSGGPLVVSGRVVGIVSWGVSQSDTNGNVVQWCGVKDSYPVFTKVSAYTGLAQERINDTDWTKDGKADLLVRTSSGQGYAYEGTTLRYRVSTGTGWSSFNKVVQTDLNRDGTTDLIMRGTNGNLYWRHWASGGWTNTRLATGWGGVRQIVAPGDLNGDALPDLLIVDSVGKVWVYPGRGNGTFGSRFQVGSGLQGLSQLVGHGDFTGDGKADLVGRNSAGALYLWAGLGNGHFAAAKTLSSSGFKSANALAATGDVNGDGHADLLVRFTNGYLYMYPGKGNGSFGSKVQMGTGSFSSYAILG